MAVITIIGTLSAGKSSLVKKLSGLEGAPAFLEGEEGVIPHEIMKAVVEGTDQEKRLKWFIAQYGKILEGAKKVAAAGLDCYVDGPVTTIEAIMASQDMDHFKRLLVEDLTATFAYSDKIVVITASKNAMFELMNQRGRSDDVFAREVDNAIAVQDEILHACDGRSNVIIIDRSQMDFANESDLKAIQEKIHS